MGIVSEACDYADREHDAGLHVDGRTHPACIRCASARWEEHQRQVEAFANDVLMSKVRAVLAEQWGTMICVARVFGDKEPWYDGPNAALAWLFEDLRTRPCAYDAIADAGHA